MTGRRLRRLLGRTILALFILLLTASAMLWFIAREALGHRAEGARLERMQASPQWRDGKFRNVLPRVDGPMLRMAREFLFGGSAYQAPNASIITVPRTAADYAAAPASGLRVTWLGHSSLLLEIDGARVLIDPVWSKRTSMFEFAGPKRFYAPPLPLAELPSVDVVLISHDHYDHLDVATIRELAARGARFAVPLGVGAHLVAWGVAEDRITEHDWWDSTTVGSLTLTAVPARHFSGRGVTDQGKTLWSGWTIASPTHRVYYSGDTAMQDAFVEIGQRLGPFDLTMIEVGAYDAMWADVHLGPEQAVRAHQLVKGNVLLPVHWGLFDLALHGWTEPIERVLAAAETEGVRVAAPRPGDRVEPALLGPVRRWWPDLPWKTAAEAPVQSTGTAHLMQRLPRREPPDPISGSPRDTAKLAPATWHNGRACVRVLKLDTKATRRVPFANRTLINADETIAVATVSAEDPTGMALVFTDLTSGEPRTVGYQYGWLNHLQFSPTDPGMLLYCHEGTWHEVDRILSIRTDGSGKTLRHARTMDVEIAGHDFWRFDGCMVGPLQRIA